MTDIDFIDPAHIACRNVLIRQVVEPDYERVAHSSSRIILGHQQIFKILSNFFIFLISKILFFPPPSARIVRSPYFLLLLPAMCCETMDQWFAAVHIRVLFFAASCSTYTTRRGRRSTCNFRSTSADSTPPSSTVPSSFSEPTSASSSNRKPANGAVASADMRRARTSRTMMMMMTSVTAQRVRRQCPAGERTRPTSDWWSTTDESTFSAVADSSRNHRRQVAAGRGGRRTRCEAYP